MLIELEDTKQEGKFYKTFIFIVFKSNYSKFQFDRKQSVCGGWTTELLPSHCTGYPQANLRKLQKMFKEM